MWLVSRGTPFNSLWVTAWTDFNFLQALLTTVLYQICFSCWILDIFYNSFLKLLISYPTQALYLPCSLFWILASPGVTGNREEGASSYRIQQVRVGGEKVHPSCSFWCWGSLHRQYVCFLWGCVRFALGSSAQDLFAGGQLSPFGIARCSCPIYTLDSFLGSRVSCCLAQQLLGSPMTLTPLCSPLLQKELCNCWGPAPLCLGVVKNWHEVGVLPSFTVLHLDLFKFCLHGDFHLPSL